MLTFELICLFLFQGSFAKTLHERMGRKAKNKIQKKGICTIMHDPICTDVG